MGNDNEEMRKMLKEMSDYPHDVFDYGCASFGEAAAWALKTIDAQQAEIERLKGIIRHDPDCANAEHDSGGCLGYSGSHDDEPVESCKKCEKYTGNTAKEGDMDG